MSDRKFTADDVIAAYESGFSAGAAARLKAAHILIDKAITCHCCDHEYTDESSSGWRTCRKCGHRVRDI